MGLNEVLKKTFSWMFLGLLFTFLTGYIVSVNPNMVQNIYGTGLYLFLAIIELVLVIMLSARITKFSPTTSRIIFLIYSFVTGLTFSSIFIEYKLTSIMIIFLITALLFGILALIGYTTKVDLSKFHVYLVLMLVGIIICSIVNIFIGNGMFEIIVTSVSIIVFLALTAYDIQKIKMLSNSIEEDKLAIYGALQLYLDFINIFIDLLRLFGNSRD